MNQRTRTERSILRQRAAQADSSRKAGRLAARLARAVTKRPRSLATHVLAAGVDKQTAAGVAGGLRTVAKRLGVEPAVRTRTSASLKGRETFAREVRRYTKDQVRAIAEAYKPRKAEYKTALNALLGA